MTAFPEAIAELQEFLGANGGENLDPYAFAGERCAEAGHVDPCVERFVYGELDPTRRLAVARTVSIGPLGTPPSLAEKLGGKLSGASEQTMGGVRKSIRRALGIGWLMMAETEPRGDAAIRPDRSAEAIWDFWASSSRDMLEDGGIPSDWAKTVRRMGSDLLFGGLKDLKLTRFLGGSKLNQLGLMYAQTGVWLRLTQTTAIDDKHFERTVSSMRQLGSRPWRWDAYPV